MSTILTEVNAMQKTRDLLGRRRVLGALAAYAVGLPAMGIMFGQQAQPSVIFLNAHFRLVRDEPMNAKHIRWADLAVSPSGERVYGISQTEHPAAGGFVTRDHLVCWKLAQDGVQHLWSVDLGHHAWPQGRLVAISPDGRFLAVGAGPRVLDAATGKTVVELERNEHWGQPAAHSLTYSPDGQCIAAVVHPQSPGGRWICVWSTTTGKILKARDISEKAPDSPVSVPRLINCMRFSPDGQRLLWAGTYPALLVWEYKTGLLETWRIEAETLKLVDCVNDVAPVQVGSNTHWIVAYAGGTELPYYSRPDLKPGFTDQYRGLLEVRDNQGRVLYTRQLTGAARSLAVSPDGRWFAVAEHRRQWKVVPPRRPLTQSGIGPEFEGADWPSTISVWEPATGIQFAVLQGHKTAVSGVAIAPQIRRIVSWSILPPDRRDVPVWLWPLP